MRLIDPEKLKSQLKELAQKIFTNGYLPLEYVEAEIDAAPTEHSPCEWISVEDRLPITLLESFDKKTGKYSPIGKFWAKDEDGTIIACDNSTGEAWTEEFTNLDDALEWLAIDMEV